MTKGFPFLLLLAALAALGLRCAQLDVRPMHTDEAVKAVKIFRQLWEGGGYRYDPTEHHGPTLAYATVAWGKLTLARDFARWSESRLRSMIVLFGVGLILLLPLVSDGLGRNATLAAALLTAVSPVMVYYSRDYIHEMLLVFFTFLALAAGWRYGRTRRIGWILLAGAAIGLMQATKETFIFNLAAAAGALLLNCCLAPRSVAAQKTGPPKPLKPAHLIAALAVWLAVALLLFSSFLTNPSGPLDAVRTFLFWSQRGQGASPHVHEWGFYWRRLLFFHVSGGPVWSEALIFALAALGGVAAFARRQWSGANPSFSRFLLFYTLILATTYTVIPYKTPWCALGFWHGAILLAGTGAAALISRLPSRRLKIAAGIVLLTGAGQLALQAWQAGVTYAADPRNPWCYAQTSPDLLNLVGKVQALAEASPDGGGMRVNVIAPEDDYWPLPWYLRRFNGAGWYYEVPGFSKLSAEDLVDVDSLAGKLRGKADAVSGFLMDSGLKKYIDTARPAKDGSSQLQINLAAGLNQILEGPSIYDSNRFQAVHLRPETMALRRQNPEGQDLIRLNRMLLEDAFTNEFARKIAEVDPYPPVTIVSAGLEPDVDGKKAGIMAGLFALRPGTFLELYVQTNLWAAYLQRHPQ